MAIRLQLGAQLSSSEGEDNSSFIAGLGLWFDCHLLLVLVICQGDGSCSVLSSWVFHVCFSYAGLCQRLLALMLGSRPRIPTLSRLPWFVLFFVDQC